jgi:hypothetical protein
MIADARLTLLPSWPSTSRLPDLAALRECFAPAPVSLPNIVVPLTPLVA